ISPQRHRGTKTRERCWPRVTHGKTAKNPRSGSPSAYGGAGIEVSSQEYPELSIPDLQDLPAGIYFVSLENGAGEVLSQGEPLQLCGQEIADRGILARLPHHHLSLLDVGSG